VENSFDKEVDKFITNQVDDINIREDVYIPDENNFSDYLKFCKLYPKDNYTQFRKYCQEKGKKVIRKSR